MSIQGGGPKNGGPKGMGAFTSVSLQTEVASEGAPAEAKSGPKTEINAKSDPFRGDSFSNNRSEKTERRGSFSDGFAESAEFGGMQSTTQSKGRTAMARMMQKTLDQAEKDITSLQEEAGAIFSNQFADPLQKGAVKDALISFLEQTQPLKKKLAKNKSRRRTLRKKKACNHLRILPAPKKSEVDEMKIGLEAQLKASSGDQKDFAQLQLLTTFNNAGIQSVDVAAVRDLHQLGDELTDFASSGLLAENMIRLLQKDFSPAARNSAENEQALSAVILDVAS